MSRAYISFPASKIAKEKQLPWKHFLPNLDKNVCGKIFTGIRAYLFNTSPMVGKIEVLTIELLKYLPKMSTCWYPLSSHNLVKHSRHFVDKQDHCRGIISRRALQGKKYLFRDIHNFHFPLKSNMAARSDENWNFSPRHRILFYYPVGQKFARNRSISYHLEDIFNVYFPLKSKMAA